MSADPVTAPATAPGEGTAAGPVVTPHDFTRPEGLNRSQQETVDAALTTWGELAAAAHGTMLRRPCTVTVERVGEESWGDVLADAVERAHAVTFTLTPLQGTSVLLLPTGEAQAMIDLRLGGTGTDEYPERPLTGIEEQLLSPIALALLDAVDTAFAEVQPVAPVVTGHEAEPAGLDVLAATDPCLVVRATYTLGRRAPVPLVLCLAPTVVRGLADALRRRASRGDGLDAVPTTEAAIRRLARVPVEVSVEFPTITTTADTLLHLSVGDELELGLPLDQPLELRVDGLLVALATLGRAGTNKACSIVEGVGA